MVVSRQADGCAAGGAPNLRDGIGVVFRNQVARDVQHHQLQEDCTSQNSSLRLLIGLVKPLDNLMHGGEFFSVVPHVCYCGIQKDV